MVRLLGTAFTLLLVLLATAADPATIAECDATTTLNQDYHWHDTSNSILDPCSRGMCGSFVVPSLLSSVESSSLASSLLARILTDPAALDIPTASMRVLLLDVGSRFSLSDGNVFKKDGDMREEIRQLETAQNGGDDATTYGWVLDRVLHHLKLRFGVSSRHPGDIEVRMSVMLMTGISDSVDWQPHVDSDSIPNMLSTTVVYLSDDLEGGDFVFYDSIEEGAKERGRVTPKMGLGNFFTAGPENVHGVKRVTRGERLTAVVYVIAKQPTEEGL